MRSISIEIIYLKKTFRVNAGCFHLRVRTRELNRHVAPFISEKAFQSDHLLHAMSRFCIEWTMLWCTMRTVKHVTGHQWKHYKQRFETPFQKWIKRHVYSTPGLELSSKSTQHSLEKLFWNWWYSRNVTLLHWMDPCSSVPCGPTNM